MKTCTLKSPAFFSVPFLLALLSLEPVFSQNAAPAQAPSAGGPKTSAIPLRIQVDPRVELLSILFRLAGNPEYNQSKVAAYTADVDKAFGKFRDHDAVKLARQFRQKYGVSYDACMSMAVHLTGIEKLEFAVPLAPWPVGLDKRWKPDTAPKFLIAARRFIKDTDFPQFLEQHKALYREAESRMKALMDKEGHLEWFGEFFGERAGANFTIDLGLLNGGCCYGVRCLNGKTPDLYCVLGVWQTDREGTPEFSSGMIGTVVHEFGHSFANPLIDRHLAELRQSGDELYRPQAAKMQSQAYGDGRTVLCESLVRACEVRYAARYEGVDAARRSAQFQKSRGFLWTEELSTLLADYETHREQYPTLESFSPRLVAFFKGYSKDFASKQASLAANRPKVLWMCPTNGDSKVDVSVTNLRVRFDRPMQDGSWSLVGDQSQCPQGTGSPRYDAARTTWTVPIKLKPGFTYQFKFNDAGYMGFQSAQGVPLDPVSVTFTTAPASE